MGEEFSRVIRTMQDNRGQDLINSSKTHYELGCLNRLLLKCVNNGSVLSKKSSSVPE